MIEIRPEQSGDHDAVRELNSAAFNQGPEASLVDRLRAVCDGYLAFVAVDAGVVVGHILFTPVTIAGSPVVGMGLAPMAVLPSRQRAGIGLRLVRHGLEHLRQSGCPFVIVLGHPDYYPRFGFEAAGKHRLRCQWPGVPDGAFMVMVFDRDRLPRSGGVAQYRPEFDEAV